jgi:serine/threonine protein kinase
VASDQPYLALALVRGSDLSHRIRAVGPAPVADVIRIIGDVAAALHYAHGRGVVHGNLHPNHVLIDEGRAAKVIGFGEFPLPADAMFGNPRHLAPEQLAGAALTPATDVYSLAETAFWLLTGRHPYYADGALEMLAMKDSEPAPSARTIRPELSPRLDAVLRRGMALKPTDRFNSIVEFADALARGSHGKTWWNFWR